MRNILRCVNEHIDNQPVPALQVPTPNRSSLFASRAVYASIPIEHCLMKRRLQPAAFFFGGDPTAPPGPEMDPGMPGADEGEMGPDQGGPQEDTEAPPTDKAEGEVIPEEPKEAALTADAKDEQTPADVVLAATDKAEAELRSAQAAAAEAETLHAVLRTQRASRATAALLEALQRLPKVKPVEASLAAMNRDLNNLLSSNSPAVSSQTAVKQRHESLETLARHASSAAVETKALAERSRVLLRRLHPLVDVASTGTYTAPSLLDVLDAPHPPGFQAPKGPSPVTSAGCTCAETSECSSKGRDFDWCKVKETLPCALRSEHSVFDASGADHRIAGAGPPVKFWDYCAREDVPHKADSPPVPATSHQGSTCSARDDILQRYLKDRAFQNQSGEFDPKLIPQQDRLAVEAMLKLEKQKALDGSPVKLCIQTPSSGSHRICPIAAATEDNSGSEWSRTHSWDFCVPPRPAATLKAPEVTEPQASEEAEAEENQAEATEEGSEQPVESEEGQQEGGLSDQQQPQGQNGMMEASLALPSHAALSVLSILAYQIANRAVMNPYTDQSLRGRNDPWRLFL